MLLDSVAENLATFLAIALAGMAAYALWWYGRWRGLARAQFVREYTFPPGLMDRLAQRRPDLSAKDRHLVSRALRQFFLAYLSGGRRFVSMPSQVTDDLWHEFILYTRHYQAFCQRAFGRMLHHTPAAVLGANRHDNTGLRRVWWHACREENIDPRRPTRLPLLFAIDGKLGIADGFRYLPDCADIRAQGGSGVYCGGDFASTDFDGGVDGFADGSAEASGDSSGDGGGGCGGGCGGGD